MPGWERSVSLCWCGAILFAVAGCAVPARVAHAGTLEDVRARGHLLCGVSDGVPGLATVDGKGAWSGLSVDYCSALAAAVTGSRTSVKFVPLKVSERYETLKAGGVDVLIPSEAWTLSRDSELGITFAGVLFHDGQGFLVRRGDAVSSVLELSGSSICAMTGTRAEQGIADFFNARQMKYQLVVAKRWPDLVKSYASGGCTLLSGDISLLALERSRLDSPSDHLLLPELITKEPIGPAVRKGEDQWFSVVRWVLMSLITAEELGVTSANVDDRRNSALVEVRRLLAADQHPGPALGLAKDWSYQVIKQVGSYGEIYERNLGSKSPLKLERGLNALWSNGGLMYAPPFR